MIKIVLIIIGIYLFCGFLNKEEERNSDED